MKLATIEMTCRSMPNQFEGELIDGRPWYFNARWGYWYLAVGVAGQTASDICVDGSLIVADGDHPEAGWWTEHEAEAFCRWAIETAGSK